MSRRVPAMELMLAYTAGLAVTADELLDLTGIHCLGCDQPLTSDSTWYVTEQRRTMQCCSVARYRKASQ